MITSNLYNHILIDPINAGANELFIVSGFTSGTFAASHLKEILSKNKKVKINLIHGMPTGKNPTSHHIFLDLLVRYPKNFEGYYIKKRTIVVHSKVYAWFNDGNPVCGFSGSSNYSEEAFNSKQMNQMQNDNASEIRKYYNLIKSDSELMSKATLSSAKGSLIKSSLPLLPNSVAPGDSKWIVPDKEVQISLLQKRFSGGINGVTPYSVLNWGASPKRKSFRNSNQSYVTLYGESKKLGFLPERGKRFKLKTDDGDVLKVSVQQEGNLNDPRIGKAISSFPNDKLGAYIRKRLGVPNGHIITTQNLIDYGRTDFVLKKIKADEFLFDFHI